MPARSVRSVGKLSPRDGAGPRPEPVGRSESAPFTRTGRPRSRPSRGAPSTLPAEPAGIRTDRARALPGAAARCRAGSAQVGRGVAQAAPADGQDSLKLDRKSSLADVAAAVGDVLRRSGVRAVLTGGACADLYAEGASPSFDVDFILLGIYPADLLDRALGSLGFQRRRDRFVHRRLPFHVEFPAGPLGIGQDSKIRPVLHRRRGAETLALSATDTCRDRLAAFYFWNDRQSLAAAVAIALRRRVSFRKIREWSRTEEQVGRYDAFLHELRRARAQARGMR